MNLNASELDVNQFSDTYSMDIDGPNSLGNVFKKHLDDI